MAVEGLGDTGLLSRPVRLAAELLGRDEAKLDHLFIEARVLIRLEEAFATVPDARETFLFAVNQVSRFCPNLSLCVPASAHDLIEAAKEVTARVHGRGNWVHLGEVRDGSRFQAVINIGTQVADGLPWATVNSTGWVARIATAGSGVDCLPWMSGASNPIEALAAACLGAGRAFLLLVGRPLVTPPIEISLFTHEIGIPATFSPGPQLPATPVNLEAFLVGCGAVTNGWAYTVKRLPIEGRIEAVDRQALRLENIAPYVAAGREWLGKPKVEMIAALLGPAITVTPRPEEWHLFAIRLHYGIPVPPVVVNGLDNVETRHSVQRLWPDVLIDMAAGGLTSQVILKPRRSDGICLLRALDRPANEIGWAERLACDTGLRVARILEGPTTPITEADIAAAPEDKRLALEWARQQGQLLCGRITDQNLQFEGRGASFAPAVPFVTGFSGVLAAASTMKWLMGYRDEPGLHFQHSFASGRARKLAMSCEPDCECRRAAGD